MIQAVFAELNFSPKFAYIIVSKRINSRFFGVGPPKEPFINPPSGTVIDDVVTLPERFDFFLVSHFKMNTLNNLVIKLIKFYKKSAVLSIHTYVYLGLGLVSSLKFFESESESNLRLGLEDESGYSHTFI